VNADWRNRYETAVLAAKKAGQTALRYFDGGVAVEWKADESPVTVADREAEKLLRETFTAAFPGDGFLGEEYGDTPGTTGYRWIIDPIDGTRSFIRGVPIWATMIGLEFKGELIAGVVECPALSQTYRALRGDGAYRDSRRIHVSDVADLKSAHIYYSSLSWFMKAGMHDKFVDLCLKTERQRGFGDFYGFILVAQGSGELMVEHGVHAWDVAALIPILEEAGGRMTDWDGQVDINRPDYLASNGRLHETTLAMLKG
jgi:histidinol-phosphatase